MGQGNIFLQRSAIIVEMSNHCGEAIAEKKVYINRKQQITIDGRGARLAPNNYRNRLKITQSQTWHMRKYCTRSRSASSVARSQI